MAGRGEPLTEHRRERDFRTAREPGGSGKARRRGPGASRAARASRPDPVVPTDCAEGPGAAPAGSAVPRCKGLRDGKRPPDVIRERRTP